MKKEQMKKRTSLLKAKLIVGFAISLLIIFFFIVIAQTIVISNLQSEIQNNNQYSSVATEEIE